MDTTSSTLLKQARYAAGLSQRALALRANVPQPSIARVESGDRDLNVDSLRALLLAADHRLVAVPTRRTTAAESAVAVRTWLAAHNEDAAFRQVIQLNDDLVGASDCERVVLAYSPAPPTGDAGWDNLIAGTVEYRLGPGLPVPAWLAAVKPLAEPWHVDGYTARHPEALDQVPFSLRRRHVIITASEFESV